MTQLRIRRARVLDPATERDEVLDLDVDQGLVAAIGVDLPGRAEEVVEADGLWLAPGFVDLHAHLREPGYEYKEDIETGSRAAAAGGFTTVCCMANTDPVNDRVAVTEFIRRRAREVSAVRIEPIAAATRGLEGQVMTEMGQLSRAGAVAFSDDGSVIMDAGVMRRVLEYARGVDRPVVAHCEDLNLRGDGVVHEGPHATCAGLPAAPAEAETVHVARDLELARLTGAHLHVAHVSAEGSVALIRDAKAAGIRVTAEVTPHHLSLTDERIRSYDTNVKMAPPLRSARDREALVQGLCDGTIDCVATDHAPHASHEKDADFLEAPFGVLGLQTALPIVLSLVREERLSALLAVAVLSSRPARLFGLRAGTLEVGAPADLVLIDPDRVCKVSPERILSRSKNTPFLGQELRGWPEQTFVGGRRVHALGGRDRA